MRAAEITLAIIVVWAVFSFSLIGIWVAACNRARRRQP
jgi:hypothetical protein